MSERKKNEVRRFDAESWVCVYCRPHSDVVRMTSNLADEAVAKLYAKFITEDGGFVFQICKAGVLVAAMQLIKQPARSAGGGVMDERNKLPQSVWTGTFKLLGVELRCHVLSDGQRIIEADSLAAFLDAMASGDELSEFDKDEVECFAKWQKGIVNQ